MTSYSVQQNFKVNAVQFQNLFFGDNESFDDEYHTANGDSGTSCGVGLRTTNTRTNPHHRSEGYDLDQQCSNSFVLARRCRRSGDAEPQGLRHVRLPMIDADVLTSPSAVWL
jgi:hypothetical protein